MRSVLIAFDTATEVIALGFALLADGGITHAEGGFEWAPRAANTRLLPALTRMLDDAGLRLDDVAGVVVGCGPGSFTGVRIGVATAKGLAQGLGVPLVGVGTLDAIAWTFADATGVVGVVGDAMRGEVYPALFDVGPEGVTRRAPDRVAPPETVAAEWAVELATPVVLTGNGLRKHAAAFTAALGSRALLAPQERWWPSGAALFDAYRAAGGSALLGRTDPASVLPIYTRLSDAEEAERERAGAVRVGPPVSGVLGPPETAGEES